MSTKLNIGNIPRTTTREDLTALFSQYGPVQATGIIKNPETGLSSGCGYVEMQSDADAESAIRYLNFTQYGGRTIGVSRSQA